MASLAQASPPAEELLTLEEFAAIDFGEVAELVDGKVKLMGNNNPDHSEVVLNVGAPLKAYLNAQPIGKAFAGDVTVLVRRGPDTGRGIDLAFVSNDRLQAQPTRVSALHVAPNLAVEIMSPSNAWDDVMVKLKEYFGIGVEEVWVVSIPVRIVTVFRSLRDTRTLALESNDVLECPSILPGFALPLREVFAGLPPVESA
jgi:Uma2 family endonuclease